MKYILTILLGLLLALSACKKNELPQPVEEEPKIWLKGNSNGKPFEIKAGVNATYAASLTHDLDTLFREFIFTITLPKTRETLIFNLYDDYISSTSIKDILNATIKPDIFNYIYSEKLQFNLAPKTVVVRYINDNLGQTYYSYLTAQPQPSSYFKILSVKDVEFEGKPFKLAEVSFSCLLRCPPNWNIEMTDVHGFIPFGQQ